MRSPALALAWLSWRRHRLGLALVLLYLVVVGLLFQLPDTVFAGEILGSLPGFLATIHFAIGLVYVAAVFGHGFESHLEASGSDFPPRLFTLPVPTSVLVGWPMLQGVVVVALLWVAWAQFVLLPAGIVVSPWQTALVPAGFMALTQALLWWPFGLPGARLVVAGVLVALLTLALNFGPAYGIPEWALAAVFAALIPLSYFTAWAGVARARCGEMADWRWLIEPLRALFHRATSAGTSVQQPPFPSAARAQLWLEWRCRSFAFPLMVGLTALMFLSMFFWVEVWQEHKVRMVINFLFLPLLFAPVLGGTLGDTGGTQRNRHSMSPFFATRPVTEVALVGVKLQAAVLSTLLTWAIVLLVAAVWLAHVGGYQALATGWSRLVEGEPLWRVSAAVLLIVVGTLLLTWKIAVNNLLFGLTGRFWIIVTNVVGQAAGFTLLAMLAAYILSSRWLERAENLETLWHALPWCAGAAVTLKLLLGARVLRTLQRRGLVDTRTLAQALGIWLLTAVGLLGLVAAVVPQERVPLPLSACGIVLLLPLVRLAVAPLALAWNRHR